MHPTVLHLKDLEDDAMRSAARWSRIALSKDTPALVATQYANSAMLLYKIAAMLRAEIQEMKG